MRGRLITFEGIEGCGKSTQIELLAAWLKSIGRDVICSREPGGTLLGERIRDLLKNGSKETFFSAKAELLLFEASRAQHVEEKILPAILNGKDVLCDRFFDSSIVYQGSARNIMKSDVEYLNKFATNGIIPDLTILIDIEAREGMRRLGIRGENIDRIEQEDQEFFERVRTGYCNLAERNHRFFVVDGNKSKEDIQYAIRQEYKTRFE